MMRKIELSAGILGGRMPKMSFRCGVLVQLFLFAAVGAAAERAERMVVISNDEPVGELTATVDDRTVAIDYYVDNNGRGPKIKERLVLDGGRPVEWTITGESSFGAAVDERYRWSDNEACWQSQADEGCERREEPPLYIENDGSPWALGLYARALLAAPDRSRAVLPAGEISLSELERITVGDAAITIYALKGLDLSPRVIALDEANRLFAVMSGRGVPLPQAGAGATAGMDRVVRRRAGAKEALRSRPGSMTDTARPHPCCNDYLMLSVAALKNFPNRNCKRIDYSNTPASRNAARSPTAPGNADRIRHESPCRRPPCPTLPRLRRCPPPSGIHPWPRFSRT